MGSPLMGELEGMRARVAGAPALLVGLDFDGTLTPIADRPDQVRLAASTRELLSRLSRHPRVAVAIVSGRRLKEVEDLVGVPELFYCGNHGLEIRGGGLEHVDPTAVACRADLGRLANQLSASLHAIPNAWLEDKGLTLSVHYRQVPPEQIETVRQLVHAALANAAHPFVLATGNKVFDIRPRVYWNKGAAMDWVRTHLGSPRPLVIYVGDDVTDEDAFSALSEDITVRVGASGPTAALHHVDGPADVVRFMQWLIHQLG